jgi:ribosomal protein S11
LKTNAMEKSESKLAPVWGYKHVSAPQNCEKVQMCDNTGNFICTSNIDGSTLYALTPGNPASCPDVLKRTVE